MLTANAVTRENALKVRAHQAIYNRTPNGVTHPVASIRATAGSVAELVLDKGPVVHTEQFDQTRRYSRPGRPEGRMVAAPRTAALGSLG